MPAIVLGFRWALNRDIAGHEAAALARRAGAWRLILAHGILSWVVWVGYSALAIVLAIAALTQNSVL